MGKYNDLDCRIADSVGYTIIDYHTLPDGSQIPEYDCADYDLYDRLTEEIEKHISGNVPLEYLSEQAKKIVLEWEEARKQEILFNQRREKWALI